MKVVDLKREVPAVAAHCLLQGVEVMFVSAHLFPHEGNEAVRAKEVRDIVSKRGRCAVAFKLRRRNEAPSAEFSASLRIFRALMSVS